MSARFEIKDDGFDLILGERVILRHRVDAPAFRIAKGNPTVTMVRGNFRMEDAPTDERVLRHLVAPLDKMTKLSLVDRLRGKTPAWLFSKDILENLLDGSIFLSDESNGEPLLSVFCTPHFNIFKVEAQLEGYDRITVDWQCTGDEIVWGGGEQMSHLALNDRKFPMWTSEPGVGREPGTPLTDKVSADGSFAGGDYWTTNYPQPTMLFSGGHAIVLQESCYSELDLSKSEFSAGKFVG